VVGEDFDVALSLPQRRDANDLEGQAIVEVL
jgi:hypothetical protein